MVVSACGISHYFTYIFPLALTTHSLLKLYVSACTGLICPAEALLEPSYISYLV
jgi:hypothetical protein